MIRGRNIFLFLFFTSTIFFAQRQSSGVHGRGIRFNFGPAIGIYSINQNHATSPSAKMSAMAGFKKEFRLDRKFRSFFLVGVDYFFHGINFKSYYFKPDSVKLYNKNFAYNYSVVFQEIDVPLQVKYSFTRENNSLFSPYVMLGYHVRVMLPANVTVSQEGNVLSKRNENVKFRNPFMNPIMGTFLSATAGWQKNTINNSKSGVFIEASVRYGFSQYYFSTDYSAASLYINAVHLHLLLGFKI